MKENVNTFCYLKLGFSRKIFSLIASVTKALRERSPAMIVASLCNSSPIRTLNTPLKGLFGSLPNSKQSCKYKSTD